MIILDKTIAEHPYLAAAIDCPGAVKIDQGIKLPNDDDCWKKLLPKSAVVIPSINGKSRMETEGPKMWRELHEWAFNVDIRSSSEWGAAQAWYFEWAKSIPCGECKAHWKAEAEPIINGCSFNVAGELFAATVKAHNAVNRRLGKNEMSVEDALKLYPKPESE